MSSSGGYAGSMSVDEIRKRFGLTYDAKDEAAGFKTGSEGDDKNNDNQVWYEGSDGEMKLLGTREGGLKGLLGNSELMEIRKSDTSRFDVNNEFNSESDVAGTLRYLMEGEEEESFAPKIKEVTKPDSERLATAKERVQEYESEMWSGKHAESMFAPSVDPKGFLEKYKTNFAKNHQTANKSFKTPPSLSQKES